MRKALMIFFAFVFIAAVAIYGLFLSDLSRARALLVGRSQTVETSFGTLEYAVMGKGEPVLVIHGPEGGFDQGLDMTGALADHGYRLIAPSRFGYLKSALPANLATAMQADSYAELLDRAGIQRVDVIAISAGAWSALQFAIRHPERCRALVLLVPADYLPAGTSIHGGAVVNAMVNSDFVAWAILKMMTTMPGEMTEMMLGTDSAIVRAAEPSEKARVQQILEHILPVSPRVAGMQFDVKTAATREPYPIGKITCPVLTISAEDDGFATAIRARYIAANVPHGRAVIYPTGGHALVGRYKDALREITSFLQTIRERRPPK